MFSADAHHHHHQIVNLPLQKIRRLRHVVNVLGIIGGVSVLNPNWRYGLRTIWLCLQTGLFSLFGIYTIFNDRHNLPLVVQSLCCFGINIPVDYFQNINGAIYNFKIYHLQGTGKLLLAICQPKKFRAYLDFIEMVFRENSFVAGNRFNTLYECADKTRKLVQFCLSLFLFAAIIFVAYPLYNLVMHGEFMLMINIRFPMLPSPDTKLGFWLHTMCHCGFAMCGISGSMAFDIYVAISISNSTALIAVIEAQLDELTFIYNSGGHCMLTTSTVKFRQDRARNRRDFMRNLCMQVNDMSRFFVRRKKMVYTMRVY